MPEMEAMQGNLCSLVRKGIFSREESENITLEKYKTLAISKIRFSRFLFFGKIPSAYRNLSIDKYLNSTIGEMPKDHEYTPGFIVTPEMISELNP